MMFQWNLSKRYAVLMRTIHSLIFVVYSVVTLSAKSRIETLYGADSGSVVKYSTSTLVQVNSKRPYFATSSSSMILAISILANYSPDRFYFVLKLALLTELGLSQCMYESVLVSFICCNNIYTTSVPGQNGVLPTPE